MSATDRALELLRKHSRAGVLIDTNLLLLWLLGRVDRAGITKWKRTSAYDEDTYALLAGMLRDVKRFVVTPHIAAETTNLGWQYSGPACSEFRRLVGAYLELATERYVESRVIVPLPEFARLGLTDTAVLRLRRRLPVVLTDDFHLAVALEKRGSLVINFAHLRGEMIG